MGRAGRGGAWGGRPGTGQWWAGAPGLVSGPPPHPAFLLSRHWTARAILLNDCLYPASRGRELAPAGCTGSGVVAGGSHTDVSTETAYPAVRRFIADELSLRAWALDCCSAYLCHSDLSKTHSFWEMATLPPPAAAAPRALVASRGPLGLVCSAAVRWSCRWTPWTPSSRHQCTWV